MLTLAQVNELADTMIANDLASLEVKGSDYAVRMIRARKASSEGKGPRLKPALIKAVSPATGPFYPRGLDDGLPVLKSGAQVLAKEPLGYIGIGPFRVLCVAPATGRVVGGLPAPEETVKMGDALFTVEPSR